MIVTVVEDNNKKRRGPYEPPTVLLNLAVLEVDFVLLK